jgi:hypothetical protein
MKRQHIMLMSCLVLAMFTMAAWAQVREGIFQLELYGPEEAQWNQDLNSGYNNAWYRYPQTAPSDPPPPWWNEWFYNDPYIIGGKWVQIMFDYQLIDPTQPGNVFVTLNWTNGLWVGENAPPVPDAGYDPEIYIERLTDYGVIWEFDLPAGTLPGDWDSGKYWLPIDYNPEWVSVDVQGLGNVGILNGIILHECVPEPSTLLLLSVGAVMFARRRR